MNGAVNNSIKAAKAEASIEIGRGLNRFSAKEAAEEAARKAKAERDFLEAILSQIIPPVSQSTDNVIVFKNAAAKEAVRSAFTATVSQFPEHKIEGDKAVFSNAYSNLIVEARKITYAAKPLAADADAPKRPFDEDAAYAMAKWAAANPDAIRNGIKLRGSEAKQALLRAAIAKVNEELPEGQKLRIRGDNITPVMNAVATPNHDNDNNVEYAHAPKASGQGAEQEAQHVENAPTKKRGSLFGFVRKLAGKIFARKPVDKEKAARDEAAQERAVMSRRQVLTGGLALVGATALASLPEEANAMTQKEKLEIFRAKSGQYPELEEKYFGKKSRQKKKTKAKTKENAAARNRKAAELKKERAAKRKEEARKKKEQARKQEQKRKKKQEQARKPEKKPAEKKKEKKAPEKGKAEARDRAEGRETSNKAKAGYGTVRLVCTHTGRTAILDLSNPRACKSAFDLVAQDHRAKRKGNMAPGLLTYIVRITTDLRSRGHSVYQFNIVSGYRTKATNEWLIKESKKRNGGKSGVANKSFHMDGKAVDFNIPGVSLTQAHNAAKRAGGWTKKYDSSGFVHIDTRGAYTV